MFSKSIKIVLMSAIFAGLGSSAYAQEMEELVVGVASGDVEVEDVISWIYNKRNS